MAVSTAVRTYYAERIFAKLRPDAIEGFGTLVEIRLDPSAATAPPR